MTTDPFEVLGLDLSATADDIGAARRQLARQHHPDRGGDRWRMQAINEAADAALVIVESSSGRVVSSSAPSPSAMYDPETRSAAARDFPSFTVEALPAEAFEGILVVASWLGEVLDDDPPYRLDTFLHDFNCWCRLEVTPDAGASTVALTVAGIDGAATPDVVVVRDAWVEGLNAVDWP